MAKLRSSAISPSVVVGAVNEGRPHPLAPLARYVGVAVMFVGLAGLVPLAVLPAHPAEVPLAPPKLGCWECFVDVFCILVDGGFL